MATKKWNKSLLQNFDAFIFDCDGVLWRGGAILPGTVDMLQRLGALGKTILFCTNNSSKSRLQYHEKLTKMGINCKPGQIYSSAVGGAAYYSKQPEFMGTDAKKLLVFGAEGLKRECETWGLTCVALNELFPPGNTHKSADELDAMVLDPEIGGVLQGGDMNLTYSKVAYASACIREIPGCRYVSTNQDLSFPTQTRLLPGGGTCVRMLEAATGVKAFNLGKPESWLLDLARDEHKLDPARTLMVGDRLDTDVLFGKRGGLSTLLVLTGVTKAEHLSGHEIVPDYVVQTVATLDTEEETTA